MIKRLQLFISVLTPFVIWTLTQLASNKIELYHVDVAITYTEIVAFLMAGTLNIVLFILIASKDRFHERYNIGLAQTLCIFGMINFYAYAFLTWKWLNSTQLTKELDIVLDTVYGLVNLSVVAYGIIVCQFIAVSMFNKSIIPFIEISKKKPIGHYLKEMGACTDKELQEAFERQKKDENGKEEDD